MYREVAGALLTPGNRLIQLVAATWEPKTPAMKTPRPINLQLRGNPRVRRLPAAMMSREARKITGLPHLSIRRPETAELILPQSCIKKMDARIVLGRL